MFQPREYYDKNLLNLKNSAYDELPESFKKKLDIDSKIKTQV